MRCKLFVLFAAVVVAAGVAAVAARPAAASTTTDRQVKQNVLLLRGYIDTWAAKNGFAYALKSQVKKGGGLPAPIWPENPYTGGPMAPGTRRGCFTYTRDRDGLGYTLVGHLGSGGSYTVSGGSPSWLAVERTIAEQKEVIAKDALTELGVRVIKGYIQEWGLLHNAMAPSLAEVMAGGVGAGKDFWPRNPWTGLPMANGSSTGDFAYAAGDGAAYSLSALQSVGPVVLDGSVPAQIKTALDAMRDELVRTDMEYLQAVVDRYALHHNGVFPESVDKATLNQYYLGSWPRNPWTTGDMQSGTQPGDLTYTTTALHDSYTLAGHLSDGSDYTVDSFWAERLNDMRNVLKDRTAQYGVQVIKDYVEAWKTAHGGALPTADELTWTGAVSLAQTWWPKDPFSNAPMMPGTDTGQFQYAPAGDAYSLTVREVPFLGPEYYGEYPEYYAAQ